MWDVVSWAQILALEGHTDGQSMVDILYSGPTSYRVANPTEAPGFGAAPTPGFGAGRHAAEVPGGVMVCVGPGGGQEIRGTTRHVGGAWACG